MGSFTYRDKEYDAEKLVLCGGQGAPARIDLKDINQVGNLESEHVIVVACEGRYDMLAGKLCRNQQTGEVSEKQKVRILSKPVLKKALIQETPLSQEPQAPVVQARPHFGQPRQYDRRPEQRRDDRPRYSENSGYPQHRRAF